MGKMIFLKKQQKTFSILILEAGVAGVYHFSRLAPFTSVPANPPGDLES